MGRPSLGLPGAFVALAAISSLGCNDLPTEMSRPPEIERFALSETDALAFGSALDDVRGRILPELKANAAAIEPLLAEMVRAITTRDQAALRSAIERTETMLARLEANDAEADAVAMELDAVRLILDQARPLAMGAADPVKQ